MNKKILISIIIVLVALVTGITFAVLSYSQSTNNTNLTKSGKIDIDFNPGSGFNGSINPSSDKSGGLSNVTTIKLKTGSLAANGNILLNISSISSSIATSSLKWEVYKDSETTAYASGDFNGKSSGSVITLVNGYTLTTTQTTFTIYIWLDGTTTGNEVKDATFTASVSANAELNKPTSNTPVSFSSDSWATIKANTTSSVYNVGDTKCIALTGFTTTNSNGCSSGEFKVRIANKSTPSDCSGSDYSQTACGFVIEFVDIITVHEMNPSTETYVYGTNDGSWPATSMRTYVNSDIYNAMPNDLRSVIATTKVVTGNGLNDSSIFTSNDKIYLLSPKEVWEDDSNSYTEHDNGADKTRQLDYYSGAEVTTSSYSGAIKQYNGSNTSWWLRTPIPGNDDTVHYVRDDGDWFAEFVFGEFGVAPAFRIVP